MTTTAPGGTVEGLAVDWAARRDLFALDPRVAYLNHGGFGVVPVPVRRAQQRLRDEMDANPMAFFSRGLVDRLAHTRAHLAAFLGADAAGAALVANATAAANAVLRSVPLAAGQEMLRVLTAQQRPAADVAGDVELVRMDVASTRHDDPARVATPSRRIGKYRRTSRQRPARRPLGMAGR